MRNPIRRLITALAVSVATLVSVASNAAEPAGANDNPLAPLARLVGGEWHMRDSYQTFEWSVDGRTIVTRGYAVGESGPKLVSEGMWFWHPGEQQVRCYAVAVDMGVDFFDYTTHFDGDTIVNDLRCYGTYSGEYRETWRFTDNNHYSWTLLREGAEGLEDFMEGTFTRRPSD